MAPRRLLHALVGAAVTLRADAATGNSRITSISPTSLSINHATDITMSGSVYIVGDKAALLTDCTLGTPSVDISTGTGSFTIAAAGTYKLCMQANGMSDSVEQLGITVTAMAATSPTAISAVSPTGATVNVATVVTFTGFTSGALATFAPTGTCSTATPNVDISSVSGTFTMTSTGLHDLCLRAASGSDEVAQTASAAKVTVQAATSATAITAIAPTTLLATRTSGLKLTFAGAAGAGDRALLVASASSCVGQSPTVDVSSGTGYFTVASAGTYKLCFRQGGGSDSIEQTGVTVTAAATTSAETFSTLTPASVSASTATSITFFPNPATGDKAEFVTSGTACPGAPATDISSGSATFTLGSTGTWELCLSTTAGGVVKQTSPTLTVAAATSATIITAISPTSMTAGIGTIISMAGHLAGGKAGFVLSGTACSTITPSVALSGTGDGTFTIMTSGTYDLCYQQSGRTDSVQQPGISLTVLAGGVGTDPIAWYGDKKRVFVLPPGELVPLLRTPDMTLSGSTFEGTTSEEQWFGRMVISSPDNARFMELAISKDIASFNRSASPRLGFESLEVTMWGMTPRSERIITRVLTLDTAVPFSFFGADIAFRRIQRSHRTQFPTIGRARRECMDFVGGYLHFYICSAGAWEYFGWQADLAVKFAHLDLVVVQAQRTSEVSGLLPELWGLKPLSTESAAYLVDEAEQPAAQAELPGGNSSEFCPGAAWAGGKTPEGLARSCGEPPATILAV